VNQAKAFHAEEFQDGSDLKPNDFNELQVQNYTVHTIASHARYVFLDFFAADALPFFD